MGTWKKVRNFKFVIDLDRIYRNVRGIEKKSIFLLIGRRVFSLHFFFLFFKEDENIPSCQRAIVFIDFAQVFAESSIKTSVRMNINTWF